MNYTPNYSMKLPGYGDNADIADLNENTTTIDELIHDNRTMIAQAYSQLESYVVGDIVENEGKLYRCIGATSGNWDSTKWTRTTLGDEIEEAGASALSDLDDVSLTTPTEGQILTYDGDEWVNADAPDVDVTKTASGNPIEVSDSASAPLVKCVSAITGSQDLHGYDKPWVGGAGKNKFGSTVTTSSMSFSDGDATNTNTDSLTEFRPKVTLYKNGSEVVSKFGGSISATGRYSINFLASYDFDTVELKHNGFQRDLKISVSIVANSVISVSFYVAGYNPSVVGGLVLQEIQAELSSTESDYEPYSNICPITAYTENTISVVGINEYGNGDKSFTQALQNIVLDIPLTPGTYTFSAVVVSSDTDNTDCLVQFISGSNVAASGRIYRSVGGSRRSLTLTWNEGVVDKLNLYAAASYVNGAGDTASFSNIQIQTGSSATDYEEFRGTTHTTTFPSAIYRGSEDVVNGEVNSSHLRFTVSSGIGLYGNYGDDNAPLFYVDIPEYIITYPRAGFSDDVPISNFYNATTGSSVSSMHDFEFRTETPPSGTSAKRVYIRDSRFTTAADFNTFIASNPIQFVFKLATEATSSVTPTNLPIKSLSGYTHIESSTGEMEIEYIAKSFQPLLDLMKKMVVANPSESATTTLSSLKVDDTVYSLPSGGGVTSIATDRNSYTLEVS